MRTRDQGFRIVAGTARYAAVCLTVGIAACGDDSQQQPPPPPPPLTTVDHPAQYADPFIGSGGFGFRFGSSFPGAALPHGLAKVGPDTAGPFGTVRFLHFDGYWYSDNYIQGFSHLHLHGTGAPDYGVLSVMPVAAWDATKLTVADNQSLFQKQNESAGAGSYAVTLDQGPIHVELTATQRVAFHRYTFDPQSGTPGTPQAILIDLSKHLEDGEITASAITLNKAEQRLQGKLHSKGGMSGGYGGYDVFFAARVRTPWADQKVWSDGNPPSGNDQAMGTGVGAALLYPAPPAGSQTPLTVELQVAVSLVSEDYAVASLAAEAPDWDFDKTQKNATAAWDSLLGSARVTGGSDIERRKFYSALYRCFLMPTIHSESDGTYLGFDGMQHKAQGFSYVSDLSLWDTYRTVNPLYSLIAPKRALDVASSLYEMAKVHGSFPKWPLAGGDSGSMIGAPAEMVVADAYLKGITSFDAAGAYQMLSAAAMDEVAPTGGRGGRDEAPDYMKYGYVPSDVGGSVSLTTEYARGDFALAELAQALGKTQDAATLHARAHSYQALYDAKVGFLRERATDGTFPWMMFAPENYSNDYVEANAWQSLWMNDHDAAGLSMMVGGTQSFVDRLSALFDASKAEHDAEDPNSPTLGVDRPTYYWPGNEPDIHYPFLFSQLGHPELTARWTRFLMQTAYSDKADGLPGNDDGGTMSAWYVFAAIGLYPIVGTDRYALSIPQFPKIEVAVTSAGNSGILTIEAVTATGDLATPDLLQNGYVQSVTLSGQPLGRPEVRHSDLTPGSTLRFVLDSQPLSWGSP